MVYSATLNKDDWAFLTWSLHWPPLWRPVVAAAGVGAYVWATRALAPFRAVGGLGLALIWRATASAGLAGLLWPKAPLQSAIEGIGGRWDRSRRSSPADQAPQDRGGCGRPAKLQVLALGGLCGGWLRAIPHRAFSRFGLSLLIPSLSLQSTVSRAWRGPLSGRPPRASRTVGFRPDIHEARRQSWPPEDQMRDAAKIEYASR